MQDTNRAAVYGSGVLARGESLATRLNADEFDAWVIHEAREKSHRV